MKYLKFFFIMLRHLPFIKLMMDINIRRVCSYKSVCLTSPTPMLAHKHIYVEFIS